MTDDRRTRLAAARLYLVCGEIGPARLDAALRGGVDMVQLRIKTASDAAILAACETVRSACERSGALFILNDRPDLAVQAGADGVHVGQDDVPVAQARATVGPERLIGLSTHSPDQVDRAGRLGVDYLGVGPVHATPTKPGRAPVGAELVRYATAHAHTPFFAIGGIDADTIAAVVAAGASRVAVVRAIVDAPDPQAAAAALRASLEREVSVGVA